MRKSQLAKENARKAAQAQVAYKAMPANWGERDDIVRKLDRYKAANPASSFEYIITYKATGLYEDHGNRQIDDMQNLVNTILNGAQVIAIPFTTHALGLHWQTMIVYQQDGQWHACEITTDVDGTCADSTAEQIQKFATLGPKAYADSEDGHRMKELSSQHKRQVCHAFARMGVPSRLVTTSAPVKATAVKIKAPAVPVRAATTKVKAPTTDRYNIERDIADTVEADQKQGSTLDYAIDFLMSQVIGKSEPEKRTYLKQVFNVGLVCEAAISGQEYLFRNTNEYMSSAQAKKDADAKLWDVLPVEEQIRRLSVSASISPEFAKALQKMQASQHVAKPGVRQSASGSTVCATKVRHQAAASSCRQEAAGSHALSDLQMGALAF